MKKTKSCYIHIPFCSNICSYCDFCKFYYQDTLVEAYLDALEGEITTRYQNDLLETLYIGGGTPSVLTLSQLERLFKITQKLELSPQVEFTIECNIQDITKEKLQLFQKYGVNRLSIGVQSFNQEILHFLDREYAEEEIIQKLNLAKQYFSNINIDLIYAIPGETISMLKQDLSFFLDLNIPHISTYSLMIEEHTKLGIQNMEPISDQLDSMMYETIHDMFTEKGYRHYEISNYGLPGYESRHNLTYWRNETYYGFGLGASGYIDSIRYTNTKNIKKYLSGIYIQEEEKITAAMDASNYAILGLRTLEGVSKAIFLEKFKVDFKEYFSIDALIKENIIIETKDSYYLNPKYWYLSNEVLVKFL